MKQEFKLIEANGDYYGENYEKNIISIIILT